MNKGNSMKNAAIGILYLLPAMVILGVFQIYPIIKVFLMSFYTQYNYFQHIVFEYGVGNYIQLATDPKFILALKNTSIFVFGVVPTSMILALFFAALLNSKVRLKKFFRNIYFLPFVTSTVAISMVWRWIFHSKHGILNYGLGFLGIDLIPWLIDPDWSMVSLIILSVWKTLGYNILILLTGLQNIDEQYYMASKIDGANSWKRFTRVTIPLLSPTLFFVSITSLIGSFKVFSEVYALFEKRPGPLNSALTMVYYIYDKMTNQFSYGVAAAASVVLFIIILTITMIQFLIGKRFVHYK
ncbi:binding-protein-dependent transport systems inner membrane component [Alkaliphilus metalliredigens QYMF]|uniref:Binding-protein-dependent transport systems inner membrane component n=1 Tax=Alkaliphilus metalliredigens (strain QYMF) TaxID=293826 RepID=A6TNZ2_ALKMQ|nr:sugar ABC transporter permease [Alkaliphilus metalliredigens]ABR47910.1 binding-protein-dependent transport systems inner membrane component [Alkaliphilus metalliredigens QYMF]